MTKQYILGNWKMHGLKADAHALAASLAGIKPPAGVEVAVFPPFTALGVVAEKLRGTAIALGAQDCSTEIQGAFTGDISAAMLKDAGCRYVIIGHSERRNLHEENDDTVKHKAASAMKAGLVPVICVGEDQADRAAGIHLQVITSQVQKSLPSLAHSDTYLIAYEPVWAIGTGKTPTSAQIKEAHKTIASLLNYGTSGAHTAILYGGSVKAAGAKEILGTQGVDGVLVGGASLKADEFAAIIAAAKG